MAREGIPMGKHPPRIILMGGATRGSPGVPHDVRKLIFPTITTPLDPWINWGCSQSHQEAHFQKGWAMGILPWPFLSLMEGQHPAVSLGEVW